MASYAIQSIETSALCQAAPRKYLGTTKVELVSRPACYFLKLPREDRKVVRLLLLKPKGFTGDTKALLNPHPEARTAKVRILGKIDPTKKGFKPLVREVEFRYAPTRNIPTLPQSPYAKYTNKNYVSELKSWKNSFYAVKENGWGNFHSLINLSNDWVICVLEKELLDQKKINLKSVLANLPLSKAIELKTLLYRVNGLGDGVYDQPVLIKKLLSNSTDALIPALVQMLNTQETGRHENCTFFGLLLKVAKTKAKEVYAEVQRAIQLKQAPIYYLEELEQKLKRTYSL